ncbi:MAG: (2Fe-2S)-binding protein [Bacteroidetes bacterium]|nr:MAG: (2Fe-2S)-binding protein [Bacteroidota bacterium]
MISRDGTCMSVWQNTVAPFNSQHFSISDQIYDVVIVGGGITGVSTAFLLQQSGKKCLLLEANNLCYGTTGGTTAHLNTLLDTPYNAIANKFGDDKAKLVASSVREAIESMKRRISDINFDCGFRNATAYLFAKDEKQEKELAEIKESALKVGVDCGYVSSMSYPFLFRKAIQIEDQAKFIPTRYVYALAHEFENLGGIIQEQTRVTGVEENETINVETSAGNFECRALVYATHIPPAVNLLHLRCIPYRSYAMAVRLKGNNYSEALAYDMEDPYNYYRSQEIDGKTYLIAGGFDHKTAHEEDTEYRFLQLESHLRKSFDISEVKYKWSSQYFEADDGIPYIGHLPGHPGNIYVATGFGGNGMVYSTVAANLLSKMILGQNSLYIDLYDPNRIKPIAGFTQFIKHNADVVKQFASKLFDADKLEVLADLAPGEGRLVKYEDHKIALYKDEYGKLYALSPVCTHLKCDVRWNSAEKSWDCPCHGARYAIDGKVLTGPADRDLEKIPLAVVRT